MAFDPKSGRVEDFGIGPRYEGINTGAYDPQFNRIYGHPRAHFVYYDVPTRRAAFPLRKSRLKQLPCFMVFAGCLICAVFSTIGLSVNSWKLNFATEPPEAKKGAGSMRP